MTCIIAIIANNKIFMGSDTRVVDGTGRFVDESKPKIEKKKLSKTENILIGYAGDARIGDILHMFKIPPIGKKSADYYIRNIFIKRLHQIIEKNDVFLKGMKSTDVAEEQKNDWSLLVHIRGQLYDISSDLSIVKVPRQFHAIGSGSLAAQVAINLIGDEHKINPAKSITDVINSISNYLNNVGGVPIILEDQIKPEKRK